MATQNVLAKVLRFYVDGFRSMTIGRTLWAVILIKLFIMFAVLKVFFFPGHLKEYKGDRARGEYIMDRWRETVPEVPVIPSPEPTPADPAITTTD